MKSIWLVIGETGDYSSRREWPVAALATREEAESLAALCHAEGEEAGAIRRAMAYRTDSPWWDAIKSDRVAKAIGANPDGGYAYSVVEVEWRS